MASFLDGHGGYCTCTRDKCTDDCTTYRRFKPKPMTKADRIRSYTDEELANWLEQFSSCELCPAIREHCGYGDECIKAWLDWLKEEANDNSTT